jgi:hypothetical protein
MSELIDQSIWAGASRIHIPVIGRRWDCLSMHLSLHHLQEAEAVRLSVYASQSQCLQKRGWNRWVSEHPQLSTIRRDIVSNSYTVAQAPRSIRAWPYLLNLSVGIDPRYSWSSILPPLYNPHLYQSKVRYAGLGYQHPCQLQQVQQTNAGPAWRMGVLCNCRIHRFIRRIKPNEIAKQYSPPLVQCLFVWHNQFEYQSTQPEVRTSIKCTDLAYLLHDSYCRAQRSAIQILACIATD